MNTLLHGDRNDDDLEDLHVPREREVTLGTTMVLAIFFALAVLCSVFFGFGYSMGVKHNVSTPPVAGAASPAGLTGSSKPSAAQGSDSDDNSDTVETPAAPTRATTPVPAAVKEEAAAPASVPKATIKPAPAPVAPPAPAVVAAGSSIVQVAAVSHQEDADLLATNLRRRGYTVAIRSEPQDKLLHVQVGPFATHKEADAMRLRLQGDGFNAIVKDTHS